VDLLIGFPRQGENYFVFVRILSTSLQVPFISAGGLHNFKGNGAPLK